MGEFFTLIIDKVDNFNQNLDEHAETLRIPNSFLRLKLDAVKTSIDHSSIKSEILADCDNYHKFINLFLIYIEKYIEVLDYSQKNKPIHEVAMAYFYSENYGQNYKNYSAVVVFNKRLKIKFTNFKMMLLDVEQYSKWKSSLTDFYLKNKSVLDADFNDSMVKVRTDISGINNLIKKINASDVYARIQVIETN